MREALGASGADGGRARQRAVPAQGLLLPLRWSDGCTARYARLAWMAGTSPAMTTEVVQSGSVRN